MNLAVSVKKFSVSKKSLKTMGVSALLSFSRAAGGLCPFGICRLLTAETDRTSVLIGCLLALPLCGGSFVLNAFCPLFVYFVLKAKEKQKKPIPLYFKITMSLGFMLIYAAYTLSHSETLYDGVMNASLSGLCFPLFTFLFYVYDKKSGYMNGKLFDISLLGYAFAFSRAFSLFTVFDISLSLPAAALFTLYTARTRGFACGCACGLICALPQNGAAMGALGVLGLVYGLLCDNLDTVSLILACMLSVSGYCWLSGFENSLVACTMIALSCLLFAPFRSYINLHAPSLPPNAKLTDIKLSRYAAAFSSISSLFYTVSESAKPEGQADVCEKIKPVLCGFCEHCAGCELEFSELYNAFCTEYKKSGCIVGKNLPLHILRRCPNTQSMISAVNRISEARRENGEKGLKRLAEEYSDFSRLLSAAAKTTDLRECKDKALASKIKVWLADNKINANAVKVTGARMKTIEAFGVSLDKISLSPNEIARGLAKIARVKLSTPEFELADGYAVMRMQTIPRFRVEYAKYSITKNGETVCGDTVSAFENDEKYFYCLVSDGMGSGRDAALSSRLSALMLEKLLTVGACKEEAIKIVNRALAQKQEEVFATVDLLEIDRVTSLATLVKLGAAPTLLLRDGICRRFEAKTPPAGVLKEYIAEKAVFSLKQGDVIVMLSDGVLQTGERGMRINGESCQTRKNAGAIAQAILERAGSDFPADDMSVCVLRIV